MGSFLFEIFLSPSHFDFYCLFGCLCDPQKGGHIIHTYIIVCITIKKEGKFDKIRKIFGYTCRKAKVEKNEIQNRGGFESNQKTDFSLSMDKGSSYVILFHYQP